MTYHSFAPVMPAPHVSMSPGPVGPERVAQADVRYLCFEGGGGKGILFAGAVKSLEELGILSYAGGRLNPSGQIKGIAGSSAGALTAVLLSIGYTPAQLRSLVLRDYDFDQFFDLPSVPAKQPTPAGCVSNGHGPYLRRLFGGGLQGRAVARLVAEASSGGTPTDGLWRKLASPRLLGYLVNLTRHLGLFSGCAAHRLFDTLIAQKAARLAGHANDWQRYRNMSFAQHRARFGIELVLTGSNFSTGQTAFFSAETSPRFPVAAAARISMSLPLIYKPMVISSQTARHYAAQSTQERNLSAQDLTGVWVDGGYFNNLPQYAFVHRPEGFRHTLGFSLSDYGSGRRQIRTLIDFLAAYANFGVFGGGESQSGATTGIGPNVIPLVAGDRHFQIGTTDFGFRPTDMGHVRRLIDAAAARTLQYF